MRASLFFVRVALFWGIPLLLPGCIEPYMPAAISSPQSYLVVDGCINSQGVTTINLSRTYDIVTQTPPPVETKATVAIEQEDGPHYPVNESTTKGTYTSPNLTLNTAKNYRLFIRTGAGQEYASAYVPVKTTPPIDNVAWRATDAGLNIYVNTHDDTKASQYYRWEYEETWEIKPPYSPIVEYKNRQIQDITTFFPATCWGNNQSTAIQISNTTRLTQDVVSDFLICSYPTTSERLRSKYSILIKQHAQTQEEYQYWELLKKNTENIGTLFDPQPAQLTGNVRCLSNETELAMGFVGAHSLEKKRIFISRMDLPQKWLIQSGYESCVPPDTIFLTKPFPPPPPAVTLQSYFGNPNYLPIYPVYDQMGAIIGYTAQSRDCIDCRTRGTALRPSFWQ
ncbi:DUF4249 domain-containing protein [Hymenobacter cavernae]|uniref:DUF4249 domain-containing protein n=1 Tax=Hymenobacter cavernae TaxID=2044852 RepID=A0ABQ1TZP0_9BACT|nr:DUF4249 domain-containing protein [Hymenobacter cavernae]GGF05572.1 hypothetical protein GCM10011383_15840 [Hymenobacter cavernae]